VQGHYLAFIRVPKIYPETDRRPAELRIFVADRLGPNVLTS